MSRRKKEWYKVDGEFLIHSMFLSCYWLGARDSAVKKNLINLCFHRAYIQAVKTDLKIK